MSAEEKRIREFAYQIWQSEGCPHGEEERHWEMARKLVEAEKGPRGQTGDPRAQNRHQAHRRHTEGQGSAGCEASREPCQCQG